MSMFARSRAKSILICYLSILVIITFLAPTLTVSHAATYTVGVKAGDWIIFNDIACEWAGNVTSPSQTINQTWLYGEILNVNNFNVTAKSITLYKNGTEVTDLSWSNITVGDGNIGLFIIPSGLSAGDRIPANLTMFSDEPRSLTINGTVTRSYAGASREVNYVSLTVPIMQDTTQVGSGNMSFYWDRQIGVLCEQKVSAVANFSDGSQNYYAKMTIAMRLTATNMWPAVFSVVWNSTNYTVTMLSNSTITNFSFNQSAKTISMNLTGPTGKSGFSNIMFPKQLLSGSYTVLLDGLAAAHVEAANATHMSISLAYTHSERVLEITGTEVIPEFPTVISTLFIFTTLMMTVLYLKRKMNLAS